MKYWITKHIEGMDTSMFRINYSSLYHTGSHPVTNVQEATDFIIDEFGKGKLTYALECFRTEVAELLYDACRDMIKKRIWRKEEISSKEFFESYV